ncbi:MAG: ZIP family metal transporter [Bacteroidota bacterium]
MTLLLPILAVILGFGVAFFIKYSASALNLLLAFSGAFLLSITVLEFLPAVYEQKIDRIGIFILGGILLQIILEYLSGGAEHGHLHTEKEQSVFPYVLFISLSIHSFLEGFPIVHNHHLLVAIVVHKIPIAVIITSFLFKTNLSHLKIGLFLILFALMTPLGSFVAENTSLIHNYAVYIDALVIGIFLHISTTILFESSKNHKFNTSKFIVILLGIVLAMFLGHQH